MALLTPCNCILLRLAPWELAHHRDAVGDLRHSPECCASDRIPPWRALVASEAHLDTLHAAALLCRVCEAQPWTGLARCGILVCASCAECEPDDDDESLSLAPPRLRS